LSYFSSAITEEKEEMTLGLLRMTNLNPLSILLGKSTSRLCGALLLLAAQLPFTLLAVAFGGISTRQIMAAYCTLAAYILLLSNLALLFSVTARRTAAAAFFTGLMLFIYLVGYAILPGLLSAIGYLLWH
jgi:ABC-type Na+ efflux pump permease subunit